MNSYKERITNSQFNSKKSLIYKALFTMLLVCFTPKVEAQGIAFMHDLEKALEKAKLEDKLIFIDFYTSWCGPCKVLDKEVFSLEEAGHFFNNNFINCKVQCDDKGIGVEIGKKYQVSAYPTLMFLNKHGDMVHSGVGSMSLENLIELAKTAMNPEKNLMSLVKQWDSGDRSEAFVFKYFTKLKELYRNEKATTDFNEYFNNLSDDEKVSKFTFDLVTLIKVTPFTTLFNYIENKKNEYYKSVGQKEVDGFIAKSYLWHIKGIVNSGSKEDYETAMKQFKEKQYSYYDEYEMFYSAFLAKEGDSKYNIKEYMRRGTAFLNKYGKNNDMYTLSLTSLLGNLTGRPNEGEAGIQWMENLLERNPNPEYLNTYFYIVTRNFQFDKALKKANEVRTVALKNNESTVFIDKQIKRINDSKNWDLKRRNK
ncbi:thioredoxin family protein [Flavivirga spongiicola]|uniref:Thioredoxin domain-containing protein n=1 Tax=Flavivirga spongiicola TaxID=421621 RepID=A0ABU7XRG8_9FLAO|nr:thioredoxin domain-containing protein [Flavivirga sp. MEBiC05379]MDO5978369.1 thioredoxin domain-containing protein [Flavivirga sp. MEBiC05379]